MGWRRRRRAPEPGSARRVFRNRAHSPARFRNNRGCGKRIPDATGRALARSHFMSAVNRDIKTQAALIALARTRRMQRALAHAYLHRDAPLPTLHTSLGYMTTTA